jgi:hypothetical protein
MLSRQKVGFWLCMNDFLSCSLSLSLLSYLSERILFLCLKRDEFVCVTSLPLYWTFVLFMSNYCSDTHARYFVPFYNVPHSGTQRPQIYIYIHIERVSSMSVSKKKVWIDIYHTSFSILGAPLNCFQPIAICMRRSFIVHCCRHYSMMVYNMWL